MRSFSRRALIFGGVSALGIQAAHASMGWFMRFQPAQVVPPVATVQALYAGSDPTGSAAPLSPFPRGSGYVGYSNIARDIYRQMIIDQPTLLTCPARSPDPDGMYGVRFTSGNGLPIISTSRGVSTDTGAIGFQAMIQPAKDAQGNYADGPGLITMDALGVNGLEYRTTIPIIHNGGGTYFTAIRYVDPVNGLDSNPGTSGAPFKSLSAAQAWFTTANAPKGGRVKMRAGFYDWTQGTKTNTYNPIPVIMEPDTGVATSAVVIGQSGFVVGARKNLFWTHTNQIFKNIKFDMSNITQFIDLATYGGNTVYHGCVKVDPNGVNGEALEGGYCIKDVPDAIYRYVAGTAQTLYKCTGTNSSFKGVSEGMIGCSFEVSTDGAILGGDDFVVACTNIHQAKVCEPRLHTAVSKSVVGAVFNNNGGPDTRYTMGAAGLDDQARPTTTMTIAGRQTAVPFTTTITIADNSDYGKATEINTNWLYPVGSDTAAIFSAMVAYGQAHGFSLPLNPRAYWYFVDAANRQVTFQDFPDLDADPSGKTGFLASRFAAMIASGKSPQVAWKQVQHPDILQLYGQPRNVYSKKNAYFHRFRATGYELQGIIQGGPTNSSAVIQGVTINGKSFSMDPTDAPDNLWTVDEVTFDTTLQQGTISFVESNVGGRLLYPLYEQGTSLRFMSGTCVGMEFPLINRSSVNATLKGSSASVQGSVISLNDSTLVLNKDTSGVGFGICLYDATGTKSFVISSYDPTAQTVTVSGNPSVSGTSRWTIAATPSGKPVQKFYSNPVISGQSCPYYTDGQQIYLKSGTSSSNTGVIIPGQIASNDARYFPAIDSTVDIVVIPDALNGPYFKLPATSSASRVGLVAAIPIAPSQFQYPVFADGNTSDHTWMVIRDFRAAKPAMGETRRFTDLRAGDTCAVTHGLLPGDVLNYKGMYNGTFGPPQAGVKASDIWGIVGPNNLTSLKGELLDPITTVDGTGALNNVRWTPGKGIDGLTLELCVIDTANYGVSFQCQNGLNRFVIAQTTMPDHGLAFRTDQCGFGVAGGLIENSILLGSTGMKDMIWRNNVYHGPQAVLTNDAAGSKSVKISAAALAIDTGTVLDTTLAGPFGIGTYKPSKSAALPACGGDFLRYNFDGTPVAAPVVGAVQP